MSEQLTQDYLRKHLIYDAITGKFTRRVDSGKWKEGSEAGCLHKASGYIVIRLLGKLHKAHRLAWLYTHGVLPPAGIDHENRIRNDNRLLNLREAGQAENTQNSSIRSDNTSGVKGVSRHKCGKWGVRIKYRGKYKHLGLFVELADAEEFAGLARELLHGEFACH